VSEMPSPAAPETGTGPPGPARPRPARRGTADDRAAAVAVPISWAIPRRW